MYCQNCGTENLDSAKFCKNCGKQNSNLEVEHPAVNINKSQRKTPKKILFLFIIIICISIIAFISISKYNDYITKKNNELNNIPISYFSTLEFKEEKTEITNDDSSGWTLAKTSNGETLDANNLIKASAIKPYGQTQIELTFNSKGTEIFKELTKRLVGRRIAIFIGGNLITSPTVNTEIPNGKAIITGNDIDELISKIKSGAESIKPQNSDSSQKVVQQNITNNDVSNNSIPTIPTPSNSTYPGCDTPDIKLSNGQVWSACNVGANTAGTGSKSYGKYYIYEEALSICPSGYKLPSKTDWETAYSAYQEQDITSLSNLANKLMLPLAGNTDYYYRGFGFYWSSTKVANSASYQTFGTTYIYPTNYSIKSDSFSVRCLKN